MRTPKPLTAPEAVCTGFARVICTPSAETLRLTIERPDARLSAALSHDECCQLIALLLRYTAK